MSQILCIIDGMTDPEFSPAAYPSLQKMEQIGKIDTCCGCEPESLSCILHLLGVREIPKFLRGYAEARGVGISAENNDLILRGSWFGVDTHGRCTVPIPGPETIKTRENVCYYHLEQYKSILVFPSLAAKIQSITTYAPYQCVGQAVSALCPKGCAALEAVYWEQSQKGRCLLLWGASIPARLPPFPQNAAVITGTAVVKGIAKLLRMDLITNPAMTGDVDTDLWQKGKAAIAAAEKYEFVVLHINGADEAGHRKNAAQKREFLAKVDRLVLAELLRAEHEIFVVADHGTDPVNGKHLPELQPIFHAVPMAAASTSAKIQCKRQGDNDA